MFIKSKSQRSFEEDGKLALQEQEKRGEAFLREAEAERDPETGERPSVAERVKGAVEGAAEQISAHLPHPKP
jgi:hypothetical protein